MSSRSKVIKALDNYSLSALVTKGSEKEYDMKRFIQEDRALFNSIVIDGWGYGGAWNDDIDNREYELWTNESIKDIAASEEEYKNGAELLDARECLISLRKKHFG